MRPEPCLVIRSVSDGIHKTNSLLTYPALQNLPSPPVSPPARPMHHPLGMHLTVRIPHVASWCLPPPQAFFLFFSYTPLAAHIHFRNSMPVTALQLMLCHASSYTSQLHLHLMPEPPGHPSTSIGVAFHNILTKVTGPL